MRRSDGTAFGAIPKYLEAYSDGRFTKYDFFYYGFFSLLIFMKVTGGFGGLGRRIWSRVEGRTTWFAAVRVGL